MACPLGGTMKRPSSVPSQLSGSVHQQLNAYALAASAAGVGVLALARPTEAKIVYTPTNLQCPCNIDLNNDGTNDFAIGYSSGAVRPDESFGTYTARGLNKGNRIWGVRRHGAHGTSTWMQFASALASGALIHADRKLNKSHNVMFSWAMNCTSTSCFSTGFRRVLDGCPEPLLGVEVHHQ